MFIKSFGLFLFLVFPVFGKIRMHEHFFRGRPREGFLPKPPKDVEEKAKQELNLNIKTMWFNQRLDHFSSGIVPTYWQQRYLTNSEWYKPGGPLFVMIGGEGPISYGWMAFGIIINIVLFGVSINSLALFYCDWYKNAQIYGAYMVQLEHRFYGKSYPTPDASVANLKYLSSQQALNDLAVFILAMKKQMNIQQVIVFGGSYPGNLAAWFRLEYPFIADGAIASSAPVHAKADFFEYLEVVGNSLDYVSPGCSKIVSQAFTALSSTVASNSKPLTQLFGLCSDVNPANKMDLATFYESVIGTFQGAVQYNVLGPRSQVLAICNIMNNATIGTPLQRLAYLFNKNPNQPVNPDRCIDFSYASEVQYFKNISWKSDAVSSGARTWIYQTCTQFGYYQTTDSQNQPFGSHMSLAFEEQLCQDVYGVTPGTLNMAIQETNNRYGSLNLKANKVVLPNGSVDPWHALGILKTVGPSEIAEFYQGGSHCYDMMGSSKYDTKQLIAVRNAITLEIAKFLGK